MAAKRLTAYNSCVLVLRAGIYFLFHQCPGMPDKTKFQATVDLKHHLGGH